MMLSLFSAVSGLRTHQTRMNVIGNNVANVNTPGYKASRTTFEEVFSQTLRGASFPTGGDLSLCGGVNPMQVGLGVSVAGVSVDHTSGNLQPTSRMTDLAIERSGFFVVRTGGGLAFTRVGAFEIDGDGYLVDSDGRKVLGWAPEPSTGVLPSQKNESNLSAQRIELGSTMDSRATENMSWNKNLDAASPLGAQRTIPVLVYDSQGRTHTVVMRFTKTADNEWEWSASNGTDLGGGVITFDADGKYEGAYERPADPLDPLTPALAPKFTFGAGGADVVTVKLDFSAMTQMAADTNADVSDTDGHAAGILESYIFDGTGVITGVYSNGKSMSLGQIALANFANPGGLQKIGDNLYTSSNNSGKPVVGAANTGGRGSIAPSTLEMSNVDLSEEFTQMIITQRGFQANSRVVTISDEILQELVNLRR